MNPFPTPVLKPLTLFTAFTASLLGGCSRSPNCVNDRLENITRGDLIRAVAQGDESKVTLLLCSGANPNETLGEGKRTLTPLLVAAARKDARIAETLLRYRADPRARFEGYDSGDFLNYAGLEQVVAQIPLSQEGKLK